MSSTDLSSACRVYDDAQRATLLDVARRSLAEGLAQGRPLALDPAAFDSALNEPRGVFVTLHLGDALRGCIGSLVARDPLVVAVARSAFNAGFKDPRFPAISEAELAKLTIHVSVLGPAAEMEFASEEDLLGQLRPGVDGLILRDGARMGTFLPDVWDKLPTPALFLRQLKLKAGLAADHWSSSLRVERYTTEGFH